MRLESGGSLWFYPASHGSFIYAGRNRRSLDSTYLDQQLQVAGLVHILDLHVIQLAGLPILARLQLVRLEMLTVHTDLMAEGRDVRRDRSGQHATSASS